MSHTLHAIAFLFPLLAGDPATDPGSKAVLASLEGASARYAPIAREIWNLAELGFQEEKSSARLASELERAGFTVSRGVADMPTAFVASYGSGKPVIGILGEFDALPGLAQAAAPEHKPIAGQAAGQACGHHLLGTGALAAAIAVKDWLAASKHAGTLRYYGTPAEEGGGGKLYMIRAGLFDDVDAVVAWHPSDRNDPGEAASLAVIAANIRFHGLSSHASLAPEKGRSALDGVEAFDFMLNLMREHVPSDTRIHYVITDGGKAPNVVPDFAAVNLLVRNPDVKVLDGIWERVLKAAEGAALGTGTTTDWELESFYYQILPNTRLAQAQEANMRRVGGVKYSAEEQTFAEALAKTLPPGGRPLGSQEGITLADPLAARASTDVGDVSWVAPTAQFYAATWVPGTPAHSWQAVAAGGTTIGEKGMLVAARTLALTMVDLYSDPALLREARAEFDKRRGGAKYASRIGDRKPPLDYRK